MKQPDPNTTTRDKTLSALYQAGEPLEPPAHLDAKILRQARVASPSPIARPKRAWVVPFSIAASVVLSTSVVLMMRNESPTEKMPPSAVIGMAPEAGIASAPFAMSDQKKADSLSRPLERAQAPVEQKDEAVGRAAPTAPPPIAFFEAPAKRKAPEPALQESVPRIANNVGMAGTSAEIAQAESTASAILLETHRHETDSAKMERADSLDKRIHMADSSAAPSKDERVNTVKRMSAHDFDTTLPAEPVEQWLSANLPSARRAVWGEYMTDCGEGTGTAADAQRDRPMCAEIEIYEATNLVGYLTLLVGTDKRGMAADNKGLYFGFIDAKGVRIELHKLSDLLTVKGQ